MSLSIFKDQKMQMQIRLLIVNLKNCNSYEDILDIITKENTLKKDSSLDNDITNIASVQQRLVFAVLTALALKILEYKLDSLPTKEDKQLQSFKKNLEELSEKLKEQALKETNHKTIEFDIRTNPATPKERNSTYDELKQLFNFVISMQGGQIDDWAKQLEPLATKKRSHNFTAQIDDIRKKSNKFKELAEKYKSGKYKNPEKEGQYTKAAEAAHTLYVSLDNLYYEYQLDKISTEEFIHRARITLGDDSKKDEKIKLNPKLEEKLDKYMNSAKQGIPELKKHRGVGKLILTLLAEVFLVLPLAITSVFKRRSMFSKPQTDTGKTMSNIQNTIEEMDKSSKMKK